MAIPPKALWGLLLLIPSRIAVSTAPAPRQCRLHLYNTHTNERINVVYRKDDDYLPQIVSKLDYFLRDHRTGDVHPFDPRIFDLLADISLASGNPDARIDVVCGYRTPSTNEYLRRHTSGVAKESLHMKGEAVDIRLHGFSTARLRKIALLLHRGGVGYYRRSDFVHVDVGRVRRW